MATDYEQYLATRFFASLDGLPCLSIIAVIWHHAAYDDANPALLRHGYMGVTLFFVVSGFLVTTLLLRERDGYGTISLSKFYVRRTLRILLCIMLSC
ncbi:MAG: acyltransferase family protein [Egibacteraceae bacterium]